MRKMKIVEMVRQEKSVIGGMLEWRDEGFRWRKIIEEMIDVDIIIVTTIAATTTVTLIQ